MNLPPSSTDEECGPLPMWNAGGFGQTAAPSVTHEDEQSCSAAGIPTLQSLEPFQAVSNTASSPNYRLTSSQPWLDGGRTQASENPSNPILERFQPGQQFTISPGVTSPASTTSQEEVPVPSLPIAYQPPHHQSYSEDFGLHTVACSAPSTRYGVNWSMLNHVVPGRLRLESWSNDEFALNSRSTGFHQYPEARDGLISVGPTIFSTPSYAPDFQSRANSSAEWSLGLYPPGLVSGFSSESIGSECISEAPAAPFHGGYEAISLRAGLRCANGSPSLDSLARRDSSAVPPGLTLNGSPEGILPVPPSRVADPCLIASRVLRCSLMEHQKQGLVWMDGMEESPRRGGILADDMGLGKTVQALSLIVVRPGSTAERRTTLIVVPAGLVQQWKEAIKQLLNPGNHQHSVYVHHGSKRPVSFAYLHEHDIVITTYGTVAAEWRKQSLRSESVPGNDPILGPSSRWHRVILDEAQNIKNDRSNAAMGCCAIDTTYRWCLSATPLMNHQRELYSLFRFLHVSEYSSVDGTTFQSAFNSGYEYERKGAAEQLQNVLATVLLRRTKSSIIGNRPIVQLPSRTTEKVYVDLYDEERRFYTTLEGRVHAQLDRSSNNEAMHHNVSNMISLLQRLQRACCHPFLVTEASRPLREPFLKEEQLMENARQFPEPVILRLREIENILDCPICFDVVDDPMIFFPCGHSACVDCFGRISDTREMRCHSCRAVIDPSKATNYVSFARSNALALGNRIPDNDVPVLEIISQITEDTGADIVSDGVSGSSGEDGAPVSQRGVHTEQPQWHVAFRPAECDLRQRLSLLRKQASTSSAARRSYRQALENAWITSSKIDKTLEIVDQIQRDGTGDKVIIFSQFTSLLDLVEVPLKRRGWLFRRYDGSMRVADRHAVVVEFSTNPNCRIMLVSLRAGNSGLNLTAASKVIILDPFWNPFVEEQAIGRVHRIGQQRPVHVYRILIPDTVEDRIQHLQDEKRRLVQGTLSEASDGSVRLGRQNLTYLLGLSGLSQTR